MSNESNSTVNNRNAKKAELIERFWDRYIALVHSCGIKKPFDQWYVIRVEEYIKAHEDKRLQEHGPEDVTHWLSVLGRKNSLKDWQFKQTVHAIQILFCQLINSPWCQQIDWEHWKEGARELEENHVTVGRDYQSIPGGRDFDEGEGSSKGSLSGEAAEVVDSITRELRLGRYAYRTEKTYKTWATRFLHYCGGQNIETLGDKDVFSFLEYLAIGRKVSGSTQNQALNAQGGYTDLPCIYCKIV